MLNLKKYKHIKINFNSRSDQGNLSKNRTLRHVQNNNILEHRSDLLFIMFLVGLGWSKPFGKNSYSNIWMFMKFSNWNHLIPILGELTKNLLVRTTTENFEFSESDPQLSKLFSNVKHL